MEQTHFYERDIQPVWHILQVIPIRVQVVYQRKPIWVRQGPRVFLMGIDQFLVACEIRLEGRDRLQRRKRGHLVYCRELWVHHVEVHRVIRVIMLTGGLGSGGEMVVGRMQGMGWSVLKSLVWLILN